MKNHVSVYDSKTLSNLDVRYGEIVAFDNGDLEFPSPFILAIPTNLIRVPGDSFFSDNKNTALGYRLLFSPYGDNESEHWSLHAKGDILGLWSPDYNSNGKGVPNFGIQNPTGMYVVEHAYSGLKSISEALSKIRGFEFYADKLITERSPLGKIVEGLGLESLLPNQLRIRK